MGIVHTHPFFEGDDITGPNVCGEGKSRHYTSGGNYEDLQLLVEIATHISDFCIKSYVIDGSNITSMTVWGQLALYPKDSFFSL
ncbi:hypothetical protein NC796_25300 [Aliifodinibius sp. S!AR15-10]|uniref:hypothetical protein n=1 Tax=Aliifodinibius sp. S!AR15-10 TaxID=2950437 RepID=UPI00285AA6B7|nr:hypothetical protein [Aliifodinibius sp. S!AR15-10]MDR8394487.1 hypothetical protein [Aliifodinibius sp. S!AR15-10]